jgi:GDP-4-dehydro-6-deoxy-D-mannose reductase
VPNAFYRPSLKRPRGRNTPRAIVTGGTGFLGAYMARALADRGWETVATHLDPPHLRPGQPSLDGVTLAHLDVTDRAQVRRQIEEFRPDAVLHFAGQAYVQASFRDPEATFRVNLMGTLHLLDAIRELRPRASLLFAGSGTEYGAPRQIPTPENAPLEPTSPYASSKAAAGILCAQYAAGYGLRTLRLRIFGTTGPGKLGDCCNDFASQIAARERSGSDDPLRVGELDKRRDISDVRDATEAMIRVEEKGESGQVYNIGSGEPRLVRDILDHLVSLSTRKVTILPEQSRVRTVDEPVHLADVGRLRSLGWAPRIPFQQTLRDILENWRSQPAR